MHKSIKRQCFKKKTCTLRLPSTIQISSTRIKYLNPILLLQQVVTAIHLRVIMYWCCFQICATQRLFIKRYSTDLPLLQFLGEQYQSSFHCIPVDNQCRTHVMLLVILTALKMPVWLIGRNLNKIDFLYLIFVQDHSQSADPLYDIVIKAKSKLIATHCCPIFCPKNISVCYKKTMLNIDWHDILSFLYFDECFHES